MKCFAQRCQALAEIQQKGEARDARKAAEEIGVEGNEPCWYGRSVVVSQAYLAEHQSHTLTQSRPNGIEHTMKRQFQRHLVARAPSQHGNADAGQGDKHGGDAHDFHSLSQHQPCRQG